MVLRHKLGSTLADGVVVALDKFRHDHGHYPANAQELIPHYLASADAFSFVYHGKARDLSYVREKDGSYSLSFFYVSGFVSGANNCYYSSKTRKWDCFGYY